MFQTTNQIMMSTLDESAPNGSWKFCWATIFSVTIGGYPLSKKTHGFTNAGLTLINIIGDFSEHICIAFVSH